MFTIILFPVNMSAIHPLLVGCFISTIMGFLGLPLEVIPL